MAHFHKHCILAGIRQCVRLGCHRPEVLAQAWGLDTHAGLASADVGRGLGLAGQQDFRETQVAPTRGPGPPSSDPGVIPPHSDSHWDFVSASRYVLVLGSVSTTDCESSPLTPGIAPQDARHVIFLETRRGAAQRGTSLCRTLTWEVMHQDPDPSFRHRLPCLFLRCVLLARESGDFGKSHHG